jgi:hypothetical protein
MFRDEVEVRGARPPIPISSDLSMARAGLEPAYDDLLAWCSPRPRLSSVKGRLHRASSDAGSAGALIPGSVQLSQAGSVRVYIERAQNDCR